MSFHPIVIGSSTFNQAGNDGQYMLSTVGFGDPKAYFKITGGKRGRTGITTGGISYIFEKDVTVNSVTNRRTLLVQTVVQAQEGIAASDIDLVYGLIADFSTAAVWNRIMNGEF